MDIHLQRLGICDPFGFTPQTYISIHQKIYISTQPRNFWDFLAKTCKWFNHFIPQFLPKKTKQNNNSQRPKKSTPALLLLHEPFRATEPWDPHAWGWAVEVRWDLPLPPKKNTRSASFWGAHKGLFFTGEKLVLGIHPKKKKQCHLEKNLPTSNQHFSTDMLVFGAVPFFNDSKRSN